MIFNRRCYEESSLIETKYEVISEIPENILINRQRLGWCLELSSTRQEITKISQVCLYNEEISRADNECFRFNSVKNIIKAIIIELYF